MNKTVVSKLFQRETHFEYESEFDRKRIQRMMGEFIYTKEIIKLCKSDTIFFDVGAAIGTVGLYAAHFANKVILVEPDPAHLRQLRRNIEINQFKNCYLEELAAGERKDTVILYTNNKTSSSRPSLFSYLNQKYKMPIHMDTLDALFEKHGYADIIKIDVEGYEYETLQGMQYSPQHLFLEIHSIHVQMTKKDNFTRMNNLLSPRYELTRHFPRQNEIMTIWKRK